MLRIPHCLDNTDTITKNIETLIDASKKVGLEINIEKTKYMLSHHQNVGQNQDIKIANRSFENVSWFKYLGTTVTNQNLILGEIKSRLTSADLSSRLLSKNVKTIILPWFLTLREEHRLRVFEIGVLRRIFVPKGDEVMGEWRKLHNEDFRDLHSWPSIIRIIKSRMRWVVVAVERMSLVIS
jgi:hypothetical protein